jgi:NAD+ kinase
MPRFTLRSGSAGDRIGVLAQPTGECTAEVLTIEAWAREHGLEVCDLGTSAAPSGESADCQLVVALGGDGTILRALALATPHRAPVLGVNFGHVGFLADIHGDDLGLALQKISGGEAEVDERTALTAAIDGAEPSRVVAFNDIVVARRPGFGTARLRVVVAGEPMLSLTGDGVVVASPTGSTAYTVGAGGPAVAPTLDAIVLTPLATQGSPLRSLVVDGNETVRVESREASAPLSLEVDGRAARELPTPAALEVGAVAGKARLVRTHPRTFYRDLANHL